MEFISILYASLDGSQKHHLSIHEPACFSDLNLDKVVGAIIHGREEYDIKPCFYSPLEYQEDIYYRQGVIQDVANENLYSALMEYSSSMQKIRGIAGKKENRYYHYQHRRWELECILLYCQAVAALHDRLCALPLSSCGMTNFKNYLIRYVESDAFTRLSATALKIHHQIDTIRYSLKIKGDTISVCRYANEINYSDTVLNVFAKFKQRDVQDEVDLKSHDGYMNDVEARILDRVARLFPAIFSGLDGFIESNQEYQCPTLVVFEREIQFYLASIAYIRKFQQRGLAFCIPQIDRHKKEIAVAAAFDLALADTLLEKERTVVCNDFHLQGGERILAITGPNQGGKTTFARMVGQLHYFALLGLYVPAKEANLFLTDNIFTHFEKSENIHNLRGKLHDDLVRIKAILDAATSQSLIIMNEIFTSTTSHDAIYLGTRIIEKILKLDAFCLCVTFIDELSGLDRAIVSMMSTVENDSQASRTYKIIRKPADGVAWSTTLVQKYGLTHEKIKARLNG